MAVKAVVWDGTRVAEATIANDTGTWGNDGGGGGTSDEPDIVYQGTTAQSRKVSSTLIGRQLSGANAVDLTGAFSTYIFKLWCSNYSALNTRTTPGSELKIGSGSTAHHSYYLFGSDNYPAAGGWQFVAITPTVTGYAAEVGDTGNPSDTAISYYSWLGDYTATSKSENHVIDAIDVGRGLKLYGGNGADPDCLFQDFIDADEGTSGNRWGHVRTVGGIMYCNGELAIGENASETAVATVFVDTTGQVLVWENGLVETGYHKLRVNAGSPNVMAFNCTGATFISLGQKDNDGDRGYTTTEDSRLEVECVGTGAFTAFIGCNFVNLSSFTQTTAFPVQSCDVQCETFVQAAIVENSIIRTTSVANVATMVDPTFGTTTELNNTEFIQEGAGHAIELGTATSYNLTNIVFTGYSGTAGSNETPSSGSSAAAILNSSGGEVTLNVTSAGSVPSIRNTASSTTIVVAATQISFSGLVAGSNVEIFDDSDNSYIDGVASSGTTYSVSIDPGVYPTVNIMVMNFAYQFVRYENVDTTSGDVSFVVQQVDDRQAENP